MTDPRGGSVSPAAARGRASEAMYSLLCGGRPRRRIDFERAVAGWLRRRSQSRLSLSAFGTRRGFRRPFTHPSPAPVRRRRPTVNPGAPSCGARRRSTAIRTQPPPVPMSLRDAAGRPQRGVCSRLCPRSPCREFIMANKMLIDASHPEETRVVVVRGQKVEEFDFESASRSSCAATSISPRSRGSNRRCRPPSSNTAATGTAFSPSAKSIPTTTRSRSPTGRR